MKVIRQVQGRKKKGRKEKKGRVCVCVKRNKRSKDGK